MPLEAMFGCQANWMLALPVFAPPVAPAAAVAPSADFKPPIRVRQVENITFSLWLFCLIFISRWRGGQATRADRDEILGEMSHGFVSGLAYTRAPPNFFVSFSLSFFQFIFHPPPPTPPPFFSFFFPSLQSV